MTSVGFSVRATDRLFLGSGIERGFHVGGYPHLPGSQIRGAFAAAWIRRHGLPDAANARRAEFLRLFEGGLSFEPAYPAGLSPTPVSVLRCKYRPLPTCGGWSFDQAYDGSPGTQCEECGGPVDAGRGAVEGGAVQRFTSVALDDRERALDGALWSRDGIPRGAMFGGAVRGDAVTIAQLRDALSDASVWIGGRRSTGGRLEIDGWSQREVQPSTDGNRVILRLIAPAIVVGGDTRPVLGLDSDELTSVLGCALGVRQAWMRPVAVGGWHAASGLPKPVERAISAGSVFALDCETAPSGEALRALALRGIGLRRAEGFGTVQVNPGSWVPHARGEAVGNVERAVPDDGTSLLRTRRELRRWVAGQIESAGQVSADEVLGRIRRMPRYARLTAEVRAEVDAVVIRSAGNPIEIEKLRSAR